MTACLFHQVGPDRQCCSGQWCSVSKALFACSKKRVLTGCSVICFQRSPSQQAPDSVPAGLSEIQLPIAVWYQAIGERIDNREQSSPKIQPSTIHRSVLPAHFPNAFFNVSLQQDLSTPTAIEIATVILPSFLPSAKSVAQTPGLDEVVGATTVRGRRPSFPTP